MRTLPVCAISLMCIDAEANEATKNRINTAKSDSAREQLKEVRWCYDLFFSFLHG